MFTGSKRAGRGWLVKSWTSRKEVEGGREGGSQERDKDAERSRYEHDREKKNKTSDQSAPSMPPRPRYQNTIDSTTDNQTEI